MPNLPRFACLAAALLLAGCSLPGGLTYDPDRGLIADKGGDTAAPTAQNGGEGGVSLTSLFGSAPWSSANGNGYVVGDEPYAVKAAADVLRQGGSAADAATALYFTLSVTYPGAAGLGGGGVCVAFDRASNHAEAIDFLVRRAAAGGDYGVPGNVRGFAALQANLGRLPWARDVAYAEALAASGFPVSAALERRLKAAQDVVRLDAGLAKEFLDENGQVKPAGSIVRAPDLAMTLSAIRAQGSGAFYGGDYAQAIVKYAATQGGALTLNDLADYRARVAEPQTMMIDTRRLYMPPATVGAGSFADAVMSQLVGPDDQPSAGNAELLVQKALARALARYDVPDLPPDLGATGFAVMDGHGQAVSCAVTMNGPFGSAHTVPGTGVALARTPASPALGLSSAFLTPMILARNVQGPIRLPDEAPAYAPVLAGAGAGGPEGTAAIAYNVLRLARNENMTTPGDLPRTIFTADDTVNVIACQDGVCSVLTDPLRAGLGIAVSRGAGQ